MKRTLLLLPLLAAPSLAHAQDAGIAQKIAALVANPAKTGKCKKEGMYTNCAWPKTKSYLSVASASETASSYQFVIAMPTFAMKDLAPQSEPAKYGYVKITAGPLKNHYARYTRFKSGLEQIDLRSEKNYARDAR